MKKTPSYLLGLAETRARAAGDLLRYEKIAQDVAVLIENARQAVTAADLLIRRLDSRLDPSDIEPIRAPKYFGGMRGKLKETVIEILKREAPGSVTTTEVAIELQIRFQLTFETAALRSRWQGNSVSRLLRVLYENKLLDRLHDPHALTGDGARWRWKSDKSTSSDALRADVEARGGTVLQYEPTDE